MWFLALGLYFLALCHLRTAHYLCYPQGHQACIAVEGTGSFVVRGVSTHPLKYMSLKLTSWHHDILSLTYFPAQGVYSALMLKDVQMISLKQERHVSSRDLLTTWWAFPTTNVVTSKLVKTCTPVRSPGAICFSWTCPTGSSFQGQSHFISYGSCSQGKHGSCCFQTRIRSTLVTEALLTPVAQKESKPSRSTSCSYPSTSSPPQFQEKKVNKSFFQSHHGRRLSVQGGDHLGDFHFFDRIEAIKVLSILISLKVLGQNLHTTCINLTVSAWD